MFSMSARTTPLRTTPSRAMPLRWCSLEQRPRRNLQSRNQPQFPFEKEVDDGGVEASSSDPGLNDLYRCHWRSQTGSDIVGSDIVRIGRERAVGPSAAQRALYAWLQR
jgi:hypothetical protein